MDLSDAGLRERAKIIAAELVALFSGRNAMSPLILSELCDIRDAAMASQREKDARIAETYLAAQGRTAIAAAIREA